MEKIQLTDTLFLLGGYDLEMQTIREQLEQAGARYADHQLAWHNACVSSYRDEIESASRKGITVYGIELQEDMPVSLSYHRIDHHNDWAHLPSALEQVMQLLGRSMNRHLQLVAANDKGYIPGMLQLGATTEEIRAIRLADRQAQGVTEEDEQLAEKSLSENVVREGDLWIVRALSSHFSPICDRLYPYSRLLVYTDREWMYYGERAVEVCRLFETELKNRKVFCGGGESGYVGTARDIYAPQELMNMINRIKRL